MVYYGPISKGCERCRRRKIKCGQERPGCAQCAKAKTVCAGYRNPVDLVFRDETARLASRVQGHKKVNGKRSCNADGTNGTIWTTTNGRKASLESALVDHMLEQEIKGALAALSVPNAEMSTIQYALTPSIADRAASFFFGNFVISDAPSSTGFGDFLQKKYSTNSPDAALPAAMEALGMAGIANIFDAPSVMVKAKQRYGRALSLTNKALSNPATATTDTVLAAIWFLGIFENMVSSTFSQYRSWHTHIHGASTLIKLRGDAQFQSELGRILFFKFRGQLISSCLQRNVPVPESVEKWVLTVTDDGVLDRPRHFGPNVCAFVPASSSVDLCNLRAAIENKTITDPREIIAAALKIDQELRHVLRQDYLDWAPQTITVDEVSENGYQGRYEIHQSLLKAQSWNHLRVLIILTNEAIVQQCQILQTRTGDDGLSLDEAVLLNNSIQTIREVSLQVCSCIPYILGQMPRRLEPVVERQSQVADGLSIVWALFVCADSAILDPDLREWARRRLQYIDRATGIRQAGLMAEALLKGPNIDLPDMSPDWHLTQAEGLEEKKSADLFAAIPVQDDIQAFEQSIGTPS